VAQSAERPIHRLASEIQRQFVRHRRAILWVVSIFVVAAATSVWVVARSLPGRDALQGLGDMSQATTLYDVHNRPVFTIFKEYRVEVPLSKVSPHLTKAILAIEDQRFAEHGGVDVFRIAAAAWTDLRKGRARSKRSCWPCGSSTCTRRTKFSSCI
jgi:penicillin-binding protein 1A